MVACPFFILLQTLSHISSRTRLLTFPTKTPVLISHNHFDKSPLILGGQSETMITIIQTPPDHKNIHSVLFLIYHPISKHFEPFLLFLPDLLFEITI